MQHKIKKIGKKITDHDRDKCITTQKFSKLKSENLAARLAQASLASKNHTANFVKRNRYQLQEIRLHWEIKTKNKKKYSKNIFKAIKKALDFFQISRNNS